MAANSATSVESGKKPTTRTSSLTLADRLEILGDLLLAIEKDGQNVRMQPIEKNGVNGVIIFLQDISIVGGKLTPKGVEANVELTPKEVVRANLTPST